MKENLKQLKLQLIVVSDKCNVMLFEFISLQTIARTCIRNAGFGCNTSLININKELRVIKPVIYIEKTACLYLYCYFGTSEVA
jgi:hypothetical protein